MVLSTDLYILTMVDSSEYCECTLCSKCFVIGLSALCRLTEKKKVIVSVMICSGVACSSNTPIQCLFCFVLFCFVLFCFVLFCFVLFCFVLFCFVLFVVFFYS